VSQRGPMPDALTLMTTESDPVMHRVGTDRNITPTTQQLEGNRSSTVAASETSTGFARNSALRNESAADQAEDVAAASAPTERIVPAGTDSVVISVSASGIGPRWDTFQDRLRERRKEAVTGSTDTGTRAPSRGTEGADTLKKAG